MKMTEAVPGKRVAWLVTDNHFSFTEDKAEWKGTQIVFDIAWKGDKTEVRFTHLGLVPEYECFEVCSTSWGSYCNGSLKSLIATGSFFLVRVPSLNCFDSRAVAWGFGERRVAGDEGRIERLSQRHIHCVVRRDVFTQFPRARQKIEMRVPVKVEVSEICNGFGRAAGCNLTRTYEASEALRHLNVHQMGRMKLVLIPQQAGLHPGATRCLQQKLQ